ncbi:MAG: peptide deformylase [Gammaproteobacteria bacterium]|nr:peptide deformylase [Gammaproteobacteria bacterium]
MALLEVLHYPDPRLQVSARPVGQVDDGIRQLLDDMAETMYHYEGIGLAAVQVGVAQQMVVVDCSENGNDLLQLINPQVLGASGSATVTEGCLSLPGLYEEVTRAETVRVAALDRFGQRLERSFSGLAAVCLQHEIDHLSGRLFVERLSRLKQQRLLKKFIKQQRETERAGSLSI